MTKKLSILIVEDDSAEETEKYVRNLFSDYKLSVFTARTHKELREKLTLGKYDIAFVDFNLCGGYEADAARSARLLDTAQPECLRIGMSALGTSLYGRFDWITNEIYALIIDKWHPMKPELIRKELQKYGF